MIKEEIKEYLSNKEVKEYKPKKYNGAMVEGMPEFEKLIENVKDNITVHSTMGIILHSEFGKDFNISFEIEEIIKKCEKNLLKMAEKENKACLDSVIQWVNYQENKETLIEPIVKFYTDRIKNIDEQYYECYRIFEPNNYEEEIDIVNAVLCKNLKRTFKEDLAYNLAKEILALIILRTSNKLSI